MPESLSIDLKRATIILAEELDYARAAEKLKITSSELKKQVSELEALLYIRIFKPRQKKVEPTEDGQFLIRAFRKPVEAEPSKTAPTLNSRASQNEAREGNFRATNSAASGGHKTSGRMSLIKRHEQCGIWRYASPPPPAKVIAPTTGEIYRLRMAKAVADLVEISRQLFHPTRLRIGVYQPLVHGAIGADREGAATEK